MNLKPWYKVVTPREDLREGKPLDAAEFAVHLDKVREGEAPEDYQKPERFFERTHLTQNLKGMAVEVIRRLSGEQTETSAVFNLSTQFGGGKTHTLTLLYHLAKHGPESQKWHGVQRLVEQAGVKTVPKAEVAVFVGTEFDSLTGRGGNDGTPLRKTPWGEIAFQLGRKKAFEVVARHDKEGIAPAGDVIRKFLPKDTPCLILLDEVMNYVSRNRKSGLSSQFYDFVQNLSETVRGMDQAVLALSIPASDQIQMTPEDQADFGRLKHMLNRLGKAVIMSAETEISEIIRRRLFEWGGFPDEARKTSAEFGDWVIEHRKQIPNWFPVDQAREAFEAAYPFHRALLSVFERKWQVLPRFQRTRGILRLLALWVSRAYQAGYKGDHKDPLIGLGTAPLDDPLFRAAVFEQLGEDRLEPAVTTDICGAKGANAMRLDKEAADTIKKSRLHQKTATAIFFESNGGQTRTDATVPEIRLAVAEPALDIGNVETVLEALQSSCYHLTVEKNRYRFSLPPTMNKVLFDRKNTIQEAKIEERVRGEIQKVFSAGKAVNVVYFPQKSNEVSDRAFLTLVVLSLEHAMEQKKETLAFVEAITRESGTSARTFKNALIWCVPESGRQLREDARNLLAWEDIQDDQSELRLDATQKAKLSENLGKAQRDLRETVWRTYKYLVLLSKDNTMKVVDLGLVHSSAGETIMSLILQRLRQDGEVEKALSSRILVANWPPAFAEWSTKAVREAVFASPVFPRLLDPDAIKDTIVKGVESGQFAYVGKTAEGQYEPFCYKKSLSPVEVEISDEVFIIKRELAEIYLKAGARVVEKEQTPSQTQPPVTVEHPLVESIAQQAKPDSPVRRIAWTGEVAPQKWMNFYTKLLTKFVGEKGLKLTIKVEVFREEGVTQNKIEEAKVALQELGLDSDLSLEK